MWEKDDKVTSDFLIFVSFGLQLDRSPGYMSLTGLICARPPKFQA